MPDDFVTQPDQTVTAAPDSTTPDASAQSQPQPQSQPDQSTPTPPPPDGTAKPQPQPVQTAPPSVQQAPAPAKPAPVPQTRGQILARSLTATLDALAGPPQFRVSYNADGVPTRTPIPRTKGQLGIALALEALSGGLSGLAQSGPAAIGKAGQAGLETGIKIGQARQQAQQNADEQALADQQNQQATLAKKASLLETNMRTRALAEEAEQHGADAIDKLIAINRQGALANLDPAYVDNDGQPITQGDLLAMMQSGKLSVTDHLGPVAGRVEVTDRDGYKRWETTHVIIKDPDARVPLTQADYDRYAAGHVPGYPPGLQIGNSGQTVPLRFKANADAVLASHDMADRRLSNLKDTLAGTVWADKTPARVDWSVPGNEQAFSALTRYVSHDSSALADPFEALTRMGADKRDKDNQLLPNPDSRYVDTLATAMGGWPLITAAHQQIVANAKTQEQYNVVDSLDKAQAVVADKTNRFTPAQVSSARSFIAQDVEHKSTVAREGADARASVKAAVEASQAQAVSGTPDALGFTPRPEAMGGIKEYNKKLNAFKKNFDAIAQTESSYQQFGDIIRDISNGRDMTGAESVVGLFNAIGISAAPLAGRGFRVSSQTIAEHTQARGFLGSIQAKLQNVRSGDVISNQQLRDYATIAQQARQSQYINLAAELHASGLSADGALPTGSGQRIDPATAQVFLKLTNNDPQRARAAATAKGWSF